MTGKSTFAKALRMERERLGLTQKELADKLGCAQQNVAGMENDKSLPKPDLHDKMIEVFGPNSPVAALPPRRDIADLMARVSAPKLEAHHIQPSAVMWSRSQEFTPAPADDTSNFAEFLAPELRVHVESRLGYNGLSYMADYLSPSLLIEVKHVQNNKNTLFTGRVGLIHLKTLSLIVETMLADSEQPPKPVLILVTETLNLDKAMLRLSAEAELHNVELVFVPGPDAVAQFIQSREYAHTAA